MKMDISGPAPGSSHLAEKLYLFHGQPGRRVPGAPSASFRPEVNGVKIGERLNADPFVAGHVPNTCALVQTSHTKETGHM